MRVPDREYYDIALREYNMLEELNHDNIIKVMDIYYILMEYAGEGCDLMKYIKKLDDEKNNVKL